MTHSFLLRALVLWCLTAGSLSAQVSLDSLTGGSAATEEAPAEGEAATEPEDPSSDDEAALEDARETLASLGVPLQDWLGIAAQAEDTLAGTDVPTNKLRALRQNLFNWRESFNSLSSLNSNRISTLRAQIDALTLPEGQEVPPAITARLAELRSQLDGLQAPSLLASEAYARANGLISEIDNLLRAEETRALTVRDPSPLNPDNWAEAVTSVQRALSQVGSRVARRLSDNSAAGDLWRTGPLGLLALLAALVLLVRSPHWLGAARDKVENSQARGRAVWALLMAILQIALPVLGMSALFLAFRQFGILPRDGQTLTSALYDSGLILIATRWLNNNLFPVGDQPGPLGYASVIREKIRRTGMLLGISIAVLTVVVALLTDVDSTPVALSVVTLPILILTCILLWQFGHLLRTSPVTTSDGTERKASGRTIIGFLCLVVAIGTPILAALGFSQATRALFAPSVITLAIIGGFMVLRRLLTRIFASDDEAETSSLVPILIGSALFLLLLPVSALVWGASTADLLEVWTRFRAGFNIGETTISPGDFATFAVVFAIGYILTRVIQRSLKNTVLPRTRLDLGGRNAVVSGIGYVGITLAALIAITLAGIDLSSLAIVAGALSVGIGFGLQTIVQNFVSGIILLIERPIGEGDMIEVGGQVGYVRDISVRATRIETFDRTDVIIPNANLVSNEVTNWTRGNLVGRLILPVGVAYGSNVQAVKDVLLSVADDNPMVIADPDPQALFVAFGASSLDFELRVILRDVNWKMIVTDEMNCLIEQRLREAGIEIPFPQTDVWLRTHDSAPDPEKEPKGDQQRPAHPEAMMTSDDLNEDGSDNGADPDADMA